MTFTPDVYAIIRDGCKRSAEVVVPLLLDAFPTVSSVVDVGGGEGWWLDEFERRRPGCRTFLVDESAEETHRSANVDLCDGLDALANRSETFSLALCLEVAEHLPAAAASGLIAGLCRLAPVVVFSAAIPGQGGHGHVNEQWPGFWTLEFDKVGYSCSDDLRWLLWGDDRVEPWYQQNLFVFAREERLRAAELTVGFPVAVVHPTIFTHRIST